MPLLHCRQCGSEISSDTRQLRCDQCGTLVPFACAVCAKLVTPPFPVYEDEKYLTEENQPLCHEHYLRQCPECKNWFQADANPGYFLCPACAEVRAVAAAQPISAAPVMEENHGWGATGRESESAPLPPPPALYALPWVDYLVLIVMTGAIGYTAFGVVLDMLRRLSAR